MKPLIQARTKKYAIGFAAVVLVVTVTACGEQRKSEVQSPPAKSQTVDLHQPVHPVSSQPESPKAEEAAPQPSSIGAWEQVSSIQRVLGTITDIRISEGTIQSIDLKVQKNVHPVNNPVDYDYIGETLHLIVDEQLSAAGKLQDQVKQGSSFLVNFAQFSIPPKGDAVLASRFSYNYFFYEHDGSYTDTQGQRFDVKAELEASKPTTVPVPTKDRKLLFALDDSEWSKPLTQIPYYRQGKSETLPDTVFKQFDDGHQPWLSNPVAVALANCSRLISSDDVADLQNTAQIGDRKIVIDMERIIAQISTEGSESKVQMSKPGGITYDITLRAPKGTEVLFVKEIIENTPQQ